MVSIARSVRRALAALTVLVLLQGCGGGGGGGSDDSSTPVPVTSLKWDGGSWDQINWQ